MNYKNIDIKDLGMGSRIQYKASRVAFFVPRLLSKLTKKLIATPITKAVTGNTYDQIKNAAVDVTLQMQADQADSMQESINQGKQNLEDWQNDREYYISNLGKFKSYQATINNLVKKQNRLIQSPKKILVAKNYVKIMKARNAGRKVEKQTKKMVESIVAEYKMRQQQMKDKAVEIEALKQALQQAQQDLGTMQQDYQKFETENSDIISQINEDNTIESTYKTVEPESDELVEQMSAFGQNGMPKSGDDNLDKFGLEESTKTR